MTKQALSSGNISRIDLNVFSKWKIVSNRMEDRGD